MGRIITNLTKNLIIFRPGDKDIDPDNDFIFYVYNEYLNKVTEYISEDNLIEMGIGLITIKELYTNNIRKVVSVITPIAKQPDTHSISYNTFGFFLLVKLSIDMIISYVYARGLIELTSDIVKNESKVAYNLSNYFLENFGYERGLVSDIVRDLKDQKKFEEYYGKFLQYAKDKIDSLTIEKAKDIYNSFNSFFTPIQNK